MSEIKIIQRQAAKTQRRGELQLKFFATLRPGVSALKKQNLGLVRGRGISPSLEARHKGFQFSRVEYEGTHLL